MKDDHAIANQLMQLAEQAISELDHAAFLKEQMRRIFTAAGNPAVEVPPDYPDGDAGMIRATVDLIESRLHENIASINAERKYAGILIRIMEQIDPGQEDYLYEDLPVKITELNARCELLANESYRRSLKIESLVEQVCSAQEVSRQLSLESEQKTATIQALRDKLDRAQGTLHPAADVPRRICEHHSICVLIEELRRANEKLIDFCEALHSQNSNGK